MGVDVKHPVGTLAAATVAGGVATNQVLNNDELSWPWVFLAFAFVLLALVLQTPAAEQLTGRSERGKPRRPRRTYLRQLRASVERMETVGVITQSEFVLWMRQVYVDVQLVPKPPHEAKREPFLGKVDVSADGPVEGRPGRRRELASFLDGDAGRVLAVIGGPGSGKTTLARNTALNLCDGPLWRLGRPLPILLYLRDHAAEILRDDPPGLGTVATSARWLDGRIPAAWVERHLNRGDCVILLDGLDEVADAQDRSRVVDWVKRQIDRYPDNRFVITSRPGGYLSNPLADAEVLQVQRFTGEQISEFLRHWYQAVERRAAGTAGPGVDADARAKADDLIDRLRRTPALYDLAANPLLLTMIACVHRYRGQLPGSRAELYAETCDALLHRRQEARKLTDATGLSGPQKERVARQLALAMMRAGARDLSADEAVKAIKRALRQVPGNVAPETFLEEACKSGLLVEREHRVYAFAHLTLQEYLAAARIKDGNETAFLVGKVNDPWWRETILLWVSDADATPIIRACLESGTVRALELAFDCAEEAAEIAPELRDQLEALLNYDGEDEERRRLVTAVRAARSLRDVITLREGVTACARPVSRELYTLFARDERRAGRHTPDPDSDDEREDAPALGMWDGDAARFVTWVNGLFDDGTTYRLPTPDELDDPAIDLVEGLDHAVWTQGALTGSHPELHRPADVRRRYALVDKRIFDYPSRDLALNVPYLRAVLAPDDGVRPLAYASVLWTAREHAPRVGADPNLRILDLVLVLALTRDLALIQGHIRNFIDNQVDESAQAAINTLSRCLMFADALGHDIRLDAGLVRAANDSARARTTTGALAGSNGVELINSLEKFLLLSCDLLGDFEANLGRELQEAFTTPHGLPFINATASDVPRVLDKALAFALDKARGQGHVHGPVEGLGRLLGVTLAIRRDSALNDALDLALAPARSRDSAHEQAADSDLIRDLDFAHALAFGPAHGPAPPDFLSNGERFEVVTAAFDCLLEMWGSTIAADVGSYKPEKVLNNFIKFAAGNLGSSPVTWEPTWKNPAVLLQQADELLIDLPQWNSFTKSRWRQMIGNAQSLLWPIFERTVPFDGEAFSHARIQILAALSLLRIHFTSGNVSSMLAQAYYGLVALQERAEGRLSPNEVLLLVKN